MDAPSQGIGYGTVHSLRQKIIIGYYCIGTVLIGVSMLALYELRDIEDRVQAGVHVAEFFDMTMEMRRFEKNHLLYKQTGDLLEATGYLNKARTLLHNSRADFIAIGGEGRVLALDSALVLYQQALDHLADPSPPGTEDIRVDVRRHGKAVVTLAEQFTQDERASIKAALATHRVNLIGFILVLVSVLIAAGQILSHLVCKPLQDMEHSMEAVARGQLGQIRLSSKDREIVSLGRAFNRMLQEIDLRQRHLHFNDKLAALGTLVSGVAHELNNPLSNISTSCHILLEEQGGADPAFQQELLEQIDQQSDRARTIVRSLLEFSRNKQFARASVALRPLIEETLVFLKSEVPGAVGITVSVPDDLVVMGDKARLQQVFLNLIKNAVEATPEGEVSVLATRHSRDEAAARGETSGYLVSAARCVAANSLIAVEIRDSGTGIAAQDMPHVFDPFFTTKDVGRGTGLGLFVVYEIVKEHGGCVHVESTPGEGCSFFVMLPIPGEDSASDAETGEGGVPNAA